MTVVGDVVVPVVVVYNSVLIDDVTGSDIVDCDIAVVAVVEIVFQPVVGVDVSVLPVVRVV